MGRFSKLNKASIEGDQSKTVTVTLCSRIEYKKIFKKITKIVLQILLNNSSYIEQSKVLEN